MLFSIVVPVHNVECYLEQCLKSIASQSFLDYEVILIVNASTDSSQAICEKWADSNNVFKVIVTDVPGVSNARNMGLEASNGQWVVFVDSDDYLFANALSVLNDGIILNTDLVIANYIQGKEKKFSANRNFVTATDYQLALLDRTQYFNGINCGLTWNPIILDSVCAKAYRRDLIIKNSIKFHEKVKIGEDMLFNLDYSNVANKLYCIDEPIYYYRLNQTSASRESSYNSVINRLDYLNVLKSKELSEDLFEAVKFKEIDILLRSIIASTVYWKSEIPARKEIKKILITPEIIDVIKNCRSGNMSNGRIRNICYIIMIKLLKKEYYQLVFLWGLIYNILMRFLNTH